ncbi:hypothetical protein [Prevotella sp. MA2016]|nr:hypothetical protein [Prevotella sp. MA2016]
MNLAIPILWYFFLYLLFSYDGYNEFCCATMITILTEMDALPGAVA